MLSDQNGKKTGKASGIFKDGGVIGGSPPKRKNQMDVKDLGMAEPMDGKSKSSKTGVDGERLNSSALASGTNDTFEDSFQKMYSKELDLDEDEVPIILHELNDSAIHFISREQFERSLSLLQKAQTLLDRLQFQKNPNDRFLVQVTMHNMALCFQKMGALEECALCLDACLHQLNSQYLLPKFQGSPTKKLKKLKYECKIHMQVCALLSQLHRHSEALCHAKRAVQISQYLIRDLLDLCQINFEKSCEAKLREQVVHEEQERKREESYRKKKGGEQYMSSLSQNESTSKLDLIYYEHSVSMLERTAYRVYPIIKEVAARMVPEKELEKAGAVPHRANVSPPITGDQHQLNMKVLLGYLNQSEWLFLLNIGNIMQITPLTIHDLYTTMSIDVELARDAVLEKICYLCISYFCVSTELRFLVSSKEKLVVNPAQVKQESEFWHSKALEIACSFLPSESPLVSHILSSYQKHHAPVQESIPEEESADMGIKIIRPIKGIDKCQYQPMVRFNKSLNIALSPLNLSPNNYSDKLKAPVEAEVRLHQIKDQSKDKEDRPASGHRSVSPGTKGKVTAGTGEEDEEERVNKHHFEQQQEADYISTDSENLKPVSQLVNQKNNNNKSSVNNDSISDEVVEKSRLTPVQTSDHQMTREETMKNMIRANVSASSKEGREVEPPQSEPQKTLARVTQRPQSSTSQVKPNVVSQNAITLKQAATTLSVNNNTFQSEQESSPRNQQLNSRFVFDDGKPMQDDKPKAKAGILPTNFQYQQEKSAKSGPKRESPQIQNPQQAIVKGDAKSIAAEQKRKNVQQRKAIEMLNERQQMQQQQQQQPPQSLVVVMDAEQVVKQGPPIVAKSGQVTSKATGRLFENLEKSLDGACTTTQNNKIITFQEEAGVRQSNSQSGTRKTSTGATKRPSSKPRVPETASTIGHQLRADSTSHNTLQSAGTQGPQSLPTTSLGQSHSNTRSSSVGRNSLRKLTNQTSAQREQEQQQQAREQQMAQPFPQKQKQKQYNMNEVQKHAFASNNVSSTRDLVAHHQISSLSGQVSGNNQHSRSVLGQQRSENNFISAKSNRVQNNESVNSHLTVKTGPGVHMPTADNSLLNEEEQNKQQRGAVTTKASKPGFVIGQGAFNNVSAKPSSQKGSRSQNLLKKQQQQQQQASSMAKGGQQASDKSFKQGKGQNQKYFKDLIGSIAFLQGQPPQNKTGTNTPGQHFQTNQSSTGKTSQQQITNLLNNVCQEQNSKQQNLVHQQLPQNRRKSASAASQKQHQQLTKNKSQQKVGEFQQLQKQNVAQQNLIGQSLTTSQSQVQFTSSALNHGHQSGNNSSEGTRRKGAGPMTLLNNQQSIEELMIGIGSGPGGSEFAAVKQTKSQTNLQLKQSNQKSLQHVFSQRPAQHISETNKAKSAKSSDKKQQAKHHPNQQRQQELISQNQVQQFHSVMSSAAANNKIPSLVASNMYNSHSHNNLINQSSNGSAQANTLIGQKINSKHIVKLQQQRMGVADRFNSDKQQAFTGAKKEREPTPVFPNQNSSAQNPSLTRPDQMFPGSIGPSSQPNGAAQQAAHAKFIRGAGQPAVSKSSVQHLGAVTAVPMPQQTDMRSRQQQPQNQQNVAVDIVAQANKHQSKTETASPINQPANMLQFSRAQ